VIDTVKPVPVPPGNWLGLLGGGQLGRMFCQATQRLGYRVAVLDPAADGPSAQVAEHHIQADYDDAAGLAELAQRCAAVTTEFENVPAQSLRALATAARPVSPGAHAVAIAQDRIAEKTFIAGLGIVGIAPAPHIAVTREADLDHAPAALLPGILKVARLGYDGKGQVRVATREAARTAFAELGGVPCVLEAQLTLAEELSVVLARGHDGQSALFPIAHNLHRDDILAVTTVGAARSPALTQAASEAALAIAAGLDYCGVLCVEFFVLADGRLVVNEIAPRPHNSGHYSIDACATSQFEQQARALAGLPLGDTRLLAPTVMLNVLGDVWFDAEGEDPNTPREPDWAGVLAVPEAKLHLYGKAEARRGRKMGHVTCLGETLAQAQARARQVAAYLHLPEPC